MTRPDRDRADLADWAAEFFGGELGLRRGRIFGHAGWFFGKKVFAFAFDDGITVKFPPKIVTEKIAENSEIYRPFAPTNGVMKNWLTVAHPEAENFDDEKDFFRAGFEIFVKN